MNWILALSIPSATNIFDSGRGSLEYTSGELQAHRKRIINIRRDNLGLLFTCAVP
jgi:hypothetical protein